MPESFHPIDEEFSKMKKPDKVDRGLHYASGDPSHGGEYKYGTSDNPRTKEGDFIKTEDVTDDFFDTDDAADYDRKIESINEDIEESFAKNEERWTKEDLDKWEKEKNEARQGLRKAEEAEGWSPNKRILQAIEVDSIAAKRGQETTGKELKRYGDTHLKILSPEKRRGIEEGGPSKRTITTGYRRKRAEVARPADKGRKPKWKDQRAA